MSARDTLVTVVGAETLALAQRSGMRVLRRRRDAAAASCERLARTAPAVEVGAGSQKVRPLDVFFSI